MKGATGERRADGEGGRKDDRRRRERASEQIPLPLRRDRQKASAVSVCPSPYQTGFEKEMTHRALCGPSLVDQLT